MRTFVPPSAGSAGSAWAAGLVICNGSNNSDIPNGHTAMPDRE
jgi:hypothetical protein